MVLLAAFTCLVDFGLVLLTFVALARPEHLIGPMARLLGRGDAWRDGVLDPVEEDLFALAIRRMQIPLLVLVFLWSFLGGALVCWLRL